MQCQSYRSKVRAARTESLIAEHMKAVIPGNTPALCSPYPDQPLTSGALIYSMFVQSNSILDLAGVFLYTNLNFSSLPSKIAENANTLRDLFLGFCWSSKKWKF